MIFFAFGMSSLAISERDTRSIMVNDWRCLQEIRLASQIAWHIATGRLRYKRSGASCIYVDVNAGLMTRAYGLYLPLFSYLSND